MSRLEEFHLYHQAALEALVLGFRRVAGDPRSLRKLIRDAPAPRWPRAREKELRARLARLRELEAPPIIIENCRRELEPRALLLERVRRGEPVAEWEILDLALRAKKTIPGEYGFVAWLADAEARGAGPTPDMSEGWIGPFSARNPVAREALFGADKLSSGGIELLGGERQGVHAVASLPRVCAFFEALLERPPPPLEEYRRWYPHLHPFRFSLSSDERVPAEGPLAWEYAAELASVARAIRHVLSMLRNCEKRGWCVQVLCE